MTSKPSVSVLLGVEAFEAFSYSVMRLRDPGWGVKGGLNPSIVWYTGTVRRFACDAAESLTLADTLEPRRIEDSVACPCWVVGMPSSGG